MTPEHEHAESGVDFGLIQKGVMVFRARPGRTFTAEDHDRLVPKLKYWVVRTVEAKDVAGMRPIVYPRSFNIWHDSVHEVVVVTFKVAMGFRPDFRCYAKQDFYDEGPSLPSDELMEALQLNGMVH